MQILQKLEDRDASMERLYDMDDKEIGALIRHPHGRKVHSVAFHLNPFNVSDFQAQVLPGNIYTISLQLGYLTSWSS